ncbi:TraI domain-containing protein [Escherichia coli]|uniref:MobH family relaxase n=1 Tax=Lelliottia sp. SL45 TaxID=2994665 RepID=UPI002DD4324E|nr:MobH family relaxase [Lelliottia sp. SL45]EIH4298235.1 TraI domain-containing protein [Escherichia coli]
MNFRALYLCIKRILGIFSSQENDATSVMIEDISSLSPFAQILGDQKYTVPDHPNPEVLKFIEYPTRPTGIQTFNEQSILSLYREKLHSISMMLAISDSDIRDDAYTFTNLVLKPLVEYVRWIHLLPASENHHHNGIGGLLSHSLEVAILSLKNAHHSELRPIGYQDEEVVRRKVYLYAAFICGLVHDAGKVYDLDIVSLNLASSIIWTPSSQSLLDWARENDVVEYEIHWRKRIHNQHNIWSSVFLERILNPVCLAFLDRVTKERVYSKMITALNVYTDGNDFLSKCVRTADFYSTGTDLNVLRDPIMGLRSNDAAARAISTIKHNFTSININNYNAKPMHIIIVNGEVYLNENAFLDFVLNDFELHKYNFPQGEAGKTVLVESLVQRGYVEPYDDERVVHYFIPGIYSENEISNIFRNGIGKLEFYNLLKLRWIGLIFDSYKIPDSVPGLFSVNANKDFIYIDEQKTVTEYRRPVPGRDAITRITDTVETAVLKVNDLGRSSASIDGDIHSKKNEGSSDDFEKKAESDNEIDNDTQIVKSEGEEAADHVIPDIEESEDESAKDTESHVLVNQLHELLLSTPLSNDYIVCVDAVPYLNIDATMALLPGLDEKAFSEEPYFQLTFREGSLDGMWIVRDIDDLRLVQLGDNCAGFQLTYHEPRRPTTLKSLFNTSMYQALVINDESSVENSAPRPKQTLELPPPRVNAVEEHSGDEEYHGTDSASATGPLKTEAVEYEHYQHLFEKEDEELEIIDYTDFTQLSVSRPEVGSCATSSSVHNEKLLPEPSELPELNREQNADPQGTIERSMDVSVGQENSEPDTEGNCPPPAEVVYSQTEAAPTSVMASEEPALPPVLEESNEEHAPTDAKGHHLSPALARLFAPTAPVEKQNPKRNRNKSSDKAEVQKAAPHVSGHNLNSKVFASTESDQNGEFSLISEGDVTELEFVEIALVLHQILSKMEVAFKRKRKNRFMVSTPNTLYLTQSCVEKFGSQLEAQDLFNKLPQYLVNSGAVINTKCHAFNMPTLLAASDRAKVDIERIINNLKEAGNL